MKNGEIIKLTLWDYDSRSEAFIVEQLLEALEWLKMDLINGDSSWND